jgi:hypothetical protein
MTTPIEQTVADWHRFLDGDHPGGLDDLLHDDVVFLSPIVFTPQKGKDLTKLYLRGAGATFEVDALGDAPKSSGGGSFHYVKKIVGDNQAALEFEAEVDGTVINGVDIMTVDDDGKIIEFKVMLRPLKAIQLMHRMMGEALEQMSGAG